MVQRHREDELVELLVDVRRIDTTAACQPLGVALISQKLLVSVPRSWNCITEVPEIQR
jgi:hypothetical protein